MVALNLDDRSFVTDAEARIRAIVDVMIHAADQAAEELGLTLMCITAMPHVECRPGYGKSLCDRLTMEIQVRAKDI